MVPEFVFVRIFLCFINVPSNAVETGERLMNGRMEKRGGGWWHLLSRDQTAALQHAESISFVCVHLSPHIELH